MFNAIFAWLESRCDPFPPEPPGQPPVGFWPFVIHYTRPFWPLILASSLFATAVALIEVALFSFVGNLVDWLSETTPETIWQDHGNKMLLMSGLVLIVIPILKFFYEAIIHQGLLGNFAMRIRWEAHRYVLRQSMDFFQNDYAGRVATKVMQTALAVRDVVLRIADVLLYVVVYFTGAVVLFASSDLRLTAPLLFWLCGYLIALRYFVPRLRRVSMKQADARSVVTGRIVDSYTNIGTVKMFAHGAREDDYARDGMQDFLDTVHRQMRLSTRLTVVLNTLNCVLLFSVGALSTWLWSQGSVTTGAIAFAMGLVLRLQGMSQWILWEVAHLFENIGVVQDGIETIARDREVLDREDAKPLAIARGRIDYENIRFNYGKRGDGEKNRVIEDLSLTIEPGEKVGLVGRSGAGKSTLVNLLLRFYDLEHGRILVDGQDISEVTQESLRARIGMVTQDTSLLHRTIEENILYGRPGAGTSDVMSAIRRAQASDFIKDLEDHAGNRGLDAQVGERGVKLSGGQRQRIAIARVLLKNAPILVLDEATSALDSEVEAAIQENLYSLMEGKTVIAIAHRLSTIAAMDRLVIMDEGQIVEEGTHDELLSSGGLYAELWSRQSGGFLAQDTEEAAAE